MMSSVTDGLAEIAFHCVDLVDGKRLNGASFVD